MFRRIQFTFPEGAIFISCVDQKLLTLKAISILSNEFSQRHWQESFDGDSFASQSRFDGYADVDPLLHKRNNLIYKVKRETNEEAVMRRVSILAATLLFSNHKKNGYIVDMDIK